MTRIYLFAVLPVLVLLSLRGDTIELKTGERIEGAFKQANSAGAVIEVAGQPITIPLEKIQAIYFGVVPARTMAGPAAYQEALDALNGLKSVTRSGISYRDYAQRVLDAKVKVDRYLSSAAKDPARNAISLAMRYYELAREAWEMGVLALDVGKAIVGDPSLAGCAALKAAAPLMQTRNPMPDEEKLRNSGTVGMYVGQHPAVLWACASAKIGEAEQLFAPH